MALSRSSTRQRSGRRRRGNRYAPMSEINVTPMVDVMLVLLIVFMVAAPLMTVGVAIDLPETQAHSLDIESKPITVTVTPQGQVFLLEELIELAQLADKIAAVAVLGTEERIFVRGDASADYGAVMKVMGVLSSAGYTKIGLITEQQQGQ